MTSTGRVGKCDHSSLPNIRRLWSMGTTASAAQQAVPAATPNESVQSNNSGSTSVDDRNSLSIHSFQTGGIHKGKSIITNKVAPVVITYNCKEEFQIHDDLLKANYSVGKISETMPEHYLVQGQYFMVRDVYSKLDVLNTTSSCGAPNFRQAKGGYEVYGMGQPSLNGFKQVLQQLQSDGHKECIFFCVREEPVVFLRLENDFVPYTPRRKENLHENLHDLEKGTRVENLELAIRQELYDFAQLSGNGYYVYNDIELFKDEPHCIKIQCEEDIHVTEEVYHRPIFLLPSYRYHRLPLPAEGAPLEAQFDDFVNFLRENPCLLLLQDAHCPPPVLLFSCQTGVGRTNLAMILGTLVLYHRKGASKKQTTQNTNALPKERFQVIQNFINMVPNGETIVEEVDNAIALCSEMHDIKESIYEYKKKLEGIGEDYQIQGNSTKEYFLRGTLHSLERYFYLIAFNYYLHEQYHLAFALNFSRWMCMHPWIYRLQANMNLSELTLSGELITRGTRVLVLDERFSPDVLSTVKEMNVANFRRVPKMAIYGTAQPNSKDFDMLLESMKTTLAEDSNAAFVFNCHGGKGRTTTAMVIALLTLWHFNSIPEISEDEIVSVPDAKYTKGEFEVVMKIVQLLPDGHKMKKEVDMALDIVSETMTPMHYHLREIMISTYRQIKTAKNVKEMQLLQLRSLQYLERYIYLILFNAYLHLEKKQSWQRPFSTWMYEVASKAGVYDVLNQLGFSEFENLEEQPLSRLRYRWQQQQNSHLLPFRGEFI
ncbi:hypothetical protein FKM82_015208 [Ascaphus truei]